MAGGHAAAYPWTALAVSGARLLSDERAGRTLLSADPRTVPAGQIDQIEVRGTAPMPF